MESPKKTVRDSWSAKLLGLGVGLIGHLVAIGIITSLISLPFTGFGIWSIVGQMVGEGIFVREAVYSVLWQLGLGAGFWAILYFLGTRIKKYYTRAKAGHLKSATGTVITETIIVIMPALFLIMGLAQLAVNNITTVLLRVATYQATRSAWVWHPEDPDHTVNGSGRLAIGSGVSYDHPHGGGNPNSLAESRARLQAATILTPVAPGAYEIENVSLTRAAEQTRGMLVGSQIPVPFYDMGRWGMDIAEAGIQKDPAKNKSFVNALGTSMYLFRTARKFTFAFATTDVDISTEGGISTGGDDYYGDHEDERIKVEITYQHYNAFPLVNWAFGTYKTQNNKRVGTVGTHKDVFGQEADDVQFVGSTYPRAGHYTTFTSTLTRRVQIPTNDDYPETDSDSPGENTYNL